MIFIAVAFTAVWGVILGAPTLRLRGDYLAIVTLAFGEIVPRVFENSHERHLRHRPHGLLQRPPGHHADRQDQPALDDATRSTTRSSSNPSTTWRWGWSLLVIFFNRRLRDSRLGRAWIAVREDEVAAAAMGVNLVRTKLWAYAIGAALGGFAGAFLGTYNNTVNVDQFEFGFSVFILCMVIVGGMGNIWGVILGAIALSMINRYLLPELNGLPDKVGLNFDVTSINFGIFGFLLLVMMVLRPEGLLPSSQTKARAAASRRSTRTTTSATESDAPVLRGRAERMSDGADRRRRAARGPRTSRRSSAASSRSTTSTSRVPEKAIVSLIGPNGAGKTTFFNCLTGLYRPTTGACVFDGQGHHRQAGRTSSRAAGIARTFQNIKLFRTMTAIENVQVGMHSRLRTRVTGMLLRTPFNRREEKRLARAGGRAAAASSGSSATTSSP